MITELQDQIRKIKREKNIAILAHSYQSLEIIEVADIVGDSFQLSLAAQNIDCETVVLCGVRFMADTVKILSPEKKVILPVGTAGCPMAQQIGPERVRRFRKEHPEYKVVAYINTTTELKAVCDVCVTSSTAKKIVDHIEEKDILFIPDQNLGSYIKKTSPNKNILLWNGMCPTHAAVTMRDVEEMRLQYPDALLLVHPECPPEIVAQADYAGSTSGIINFALESGKDCIIGTEISISNYLSMLKPDRKFPVLSKRLICPNMRITQLADVYRCLIGEGGEEIQLDEELRLAAKKPIDEMIRLGNMHE